MRIIAGEFRGRTLLAPATNATRPVTDRVKQSLFDIISPWVEEAVVHDLFAGTGSMGLECLSRGAARVMFFETDRSAAGRLRKNIEMLGVGDRSKVVETDLFRWFSTARGTGDVNLVFLDPPYRFLRERTDDLRKLAASIRGHLAREGIVIFRHDAADEVALGLDVFDRREYGSMTIELLRMGASDGAGGR